MHNKNSGICISNILKKNLIQLGSFLNKSMNQEKIFMQRNVNYIGILGVLCCTCKQLNIVN